jgi:hypothetical protein
MNHIVAHFKKEACTRSVEVYLTLLKYVIRHMKVNMSLSVIKHHPMKVYS